MIYMRRLYVSGVHIVVTLKPGDSCSNFALLQESYLCYVILPLTCYSGSTVSWAKEVQALSPSNPMSAGWWVLPERGKNVKDQIDRCCVGALELLIP